ncbi:DUF4123 domain-containing protein [Stenotrophomonas sp.]|uniref:DUF4123 domain-containing protein n=1 Tax=Stenotrophomonas sp. TaxID=69392 RepID=UPI00289CBBBA|nr:DUF4123 domain-containing protein [Stenotrophomonas sp.]
MIAYVILDAAVRPDTAEALLHHAPPASYRSLFLGTPDATATASGAWLLAPADAPRLAQWLAEVERQHPNAITLLTSMRPFEAVFAHLQRLLALRLPGSGTGLLRYYDPRVMEQLHRVLTAEQRHTLLAPFTGWRTCYGQYVAG